MTNTRPLSLLTYNKKGLLTYFTLIGTFSSPRSSAFVIKYLLIMLSGPTLSRALWQSEQNYVVQLNTMHTHNRNKLLLYGMRGLDL